MIEANRQASGKKRSFCAGPLGEGKRYRDTLAASLALADEITEALGLVVVANLAAGTTDPAASHAGSVAHTGTHP